MSADKPKHKTLPIWTPDKAWQRFCSDFSDKKSLKFTLSGVILAQI